MNRFSKAVIDHVFKVLIARLSEAQIKEALGNLFEFIEKRIKDSDNTFDDNLLPLIRKLRDALGILDVVDDSQLELPIKGAKK